MCNGRTSVGEMIEELADKYQLNRKEAEVSLLQYLKTLGQKRFVHGPLDRSARNDAGDAEHQEGYAQECGDD